MEGDDAVAMKDCEQVAEVSKTMTEEEKAERLKRAEERIKQRKLEIQEEERKREIEHEKARRRDGQDLAKIKADMEWREAQKIADQKKREKKEDRLARQRVLEEIARDRANMKAKQAKAKTAAEHGSSLTVHSEKDERQRIRDEIARDRENVRAQKESGRQSAASAQKGTEPTTPTKQDYNEARLQIRLPSNNKLIHTFSADEPLSAVRLYVDVNSNDELGPFIDLSTTYPRKVFTDDEMQMSLRELGLVPNVALLATKGKDPASGTAI